MAIDLQNGYRDLKEHVGHQIDCVGYGQGTPANVALECIDCGTVLLDFDAPPASGRTKSDIVREYAKAHGVEFIEILPESQQPGEWRGMPALTGFDEAGDIPAAAWEDRTPLPTPLKLVVVRQDVRHLKGLYLTRAALAAPSVEVAMAALLEHLEELEGQARDEGDEWEPPFAEPERLSATEVGTVTHLPLMPSTPQVTVHNLRADVWLLALATGEDNEP